MVLWLKEFYLKWCLNISSLFWDPVLPYILPTYLHTVLCIIYRIRFVSVELVDCKSCKNWIRHKYKFPSFYTLRFIVMDLVHWRAKLLETIDRFPPKQHHFGLHSSSYCRPRHASSKLHFETVILMKWGSWRMKWLSVA